MKTLRQPHSLRTIVALLALAVAQLLATSAAHGQMSTESDLIPTLWGEGGMIEETVYIDAGSGEVWANNTVLNDNFGGIEYVGAEASLYDGNNLIGNQTSYGQYEAEASLSGIFNNGDLLSLDGEAAGACNYTEYGGGGDGMYDPSYQLSPCEGWWYGGLEVQVQTGIPWISSISPTSGNIGTSGSITVQGYSLNVGTMLASITGVNASYAGGNSGQATVNFTIPDGAPTGAQTLAVSNGDGTSNGVTFTVDDATPVITGISPSVWQAGAGPIQVAIYGQHFGSNLPNVQLSDSGIGHQISSYSDGEIVLSNVAVPAADPGETVYITVTANGYNGNGFFAGTGGGSPQSGPTSAQVLPRPSTTLSQSPQNLSLSTGDTSTTIATTITPSNLGLSPSFSWGMDGNLYGSCAASLQFSNSSGTGSVNTTVTASPAGCSGVFSAVAVSGLNTSNDSTQVVVPPQIMIQTEVGEAGGQTAPGDASMPSLLLVAQNRFGDGDFRDSRPGCTGLLPTNWQTTLVPCQFYGASNQTANGVVPELGYAASVFAGTTTVSVPSECEGYWSPTSLQFTALSTWASKQAGSISDSSWPSVVGAPTLWNGEAKQAVIKSSIANNSRGGLYANAPAFVLHRPAPSPTALAVVTIP